MDEKMMFKNICNLSNSEIAQRYTFLGEGLCREVYSINDDYVVKVAKLDDGSYQNRVENHVYTHATKDLLKYLCPIVWFKPNRIIMRRAIPLSSLIKDKYIDLKTIRPEKESYADLNKLTNNFMLLADDIISTSSWGIYNNENVLIDYGCTSYLGDTLYTLFYNW
ncbi:hypothetical protein G9F72_010235 [Clostridium estertheticum]|uniref:hypothetical protein n=1 Tax=Clostridium estertheticum TaxID=238834 RepID=UPI0013E93546|nr:hypothetical protein [Clostridium estertheticum]MBZ9686702.1 hypothetical protein [Clostridium estertheticum]